MVSEFGDQEVHPAKIHINESSTSTHNEPEVKVYNDAITKVLNTFDVTYNNMVNILVDKDKQIKVITKERDLAEIEVHNLRL
jgi:hypothetical protein